LVPSAPWVVAELLPKAPVATNPLSGEVVRRRCWGGDPALPRLRCGLLLLLLLLLSEVSLR
jgi:hypothetical protein